MVTEFTEISQWLKTVEILNETEIGQRGAWMDKTGEDVM